MFLHLKLFVSVFLKSPIRGKDNIIKVLLLFLLLSLLLLLLFLLLKIFTRYMQRPEQQAGCSFGTQCQWTGALLTLAVTHSRDPTMIGITVTRFCHNLESSIARSLLLLLLLLLSS